MTGIFKSTSWTLISSLWLSLSNIILLKILSDVIAVDVFGKNLYVYSNSILIGSIFGLGIGTVINQSQSIKEYYKDHVFNCLNSWLIILFLSLSILFVLFDFIFKYNFGEIRKIDIYLGIMIFIFHCFDNINRSLLTGNKIIVSPSIFLMFSSVIGWLACFTLSSFDVESSLIKGMLLSTVLNFLYSYYLVCKTIEVRFVIEHKFLIELMKNKVLLSLASQILGSLPQILISTILLLYYGSEFVAIYLIAVYIFRASLFVPSAIQRILLPYLGEKNIDGKLTLMIKCIFINGLVCIPILIFTFIFKELIAISYSFSLHNVGNIFFFAALAGFFAALSSPLGQFMTSYNRYDISLIYNFIWFFNYVVISISIILKGVHVQYIILGLVICYLIHFIVGVFFINRLKNEINN